jgi:hypothetical protein
VGGALVAPDRRDVFRTERVRGLVRLHQQKGQPSIDGLLLGIVEGHYRLINARILRDTNREHDVPVDGEMFVPVTRVVYVQKVG